MLFQLQDLKTLRSQLYSAAEYFELAYMQEDKKQAYVIRISLLPPASRTRSSTSKTASRMHLQLTFPIHSGLCCSEFTDGLDVYLHRVTKNLKEYAVKALVNTVDHLGSISFKVSSLIDQRFNEVADANLRISCIQQVSKASHPGIVLVQSSLFELMMKRLVSENSS